MYSSNLSQLCTHPYLFELLENEEIAFDRILTDHEGENKKTNHILLNQHFSEIQELKNIKKADRILLILEALDSLAFLPYLETFENLTIIESFSGISSFGHKAKISLNHREKIHTSGFELYFPFDQNQFLKILEKSGRNYILSTNQEIPQNIYQLPENEELTFVDKALAEQPENIALINNPESEIHIIAFGSYFEQRVQLSQLLLQKAENYHLSVIAKLSELSKSNFQSQLQKAKKLIIIADHIETREFISLLSKLLNKAENTIQLLTPDYQKLTTLLTDYQLEQTHFDALALFERIIKEA